MTSEQIWAGIGQLIFGGGIGVAIGGFLFKLISEKWLDSQFSLRLEKFRTEQEKELAEYRAKTASLFSRYSKIHEKEFEVLPIMWDKLNKVIGYYFNLTSPLQTFPELNTYDQEHFEEFVNNILDWNESDKNSLLNCTLPFRNDSYKRIDFEYRLLRVDKEYTEFHNYEILNKLFLSKDIFDKISKIDTLIINGIDQLKLSQRGLEKSTHEAFKLLDEVKFLNGEIEKAIRDRLHFEDSDLKMQ